MQPVPKGNRSAADIAGACFDIFHVAAQQVASDINSGRIPDLEKRVGLEAAVLVYAAVRTPIELGHKIMGDAATEVLRLFDNRVEDLVRFNNADIDIDSRLETYFELVRRHFEEIRTGASEAFTHALGTRFIQYCLGGGGKHDPVIIGSYVQLLPIEVWGLHLWWEAFPKTLEYLKNLGP